MAYEQHADTADMMILLVCNKIMFDTFYGILNSC